MITALVALAAGLALLAYAADQFVLGSARVALLGRLSPMFVGVVIVGFGTSAPELLVSALAAADGDADVALGNVVGSNVANLSLLLGVGALIVPISVTSRTVRREAPMALAATVALALAAQQGLSRLEGVVLLAGMGIVLGMVLRGSGRPVAVDPLAQEAEEFSLRRERGLRVEVPRLLLGLVGTVAGAQLLLWGALDTADRAGLSDGLVGATLVAVGTSLPELVTVVQSARRGETDLIVGNLLGSNLFNALMVAGAVGLLDAGRIQDSTLTGIGVGAAVVVSLLALVAMRSAHTISRTEGVFLVVLYASIVTLFV